MGIDELTRLAKRFASIGSSLKDGQVALVNGKAYTKQQALQRSAEYAQAAENKQTAADNKEETKRSGSRRSEETRQRTGEKSRTSR